jgi:hypothetical protein
MTEPRPFVVTVPAMRGLTILEAARANALAGIAQKDAERLVRSLGSAATDPGTLELAATLLYAYAYQLARRDEPDLTWAEAQTFRVTLDLEARDEAADAEAEASVQAAVLTGLPPSEAGALTLAQMGEYRSIAAERAKLAKRKRGA